ncbi:hypothetical protein D3C84_1032150 [compost metagenome]
MAPMYLHLLLQLMTGLISWRMMQQDLGNREVQVSILHTVWRLTNLITGQEEDYQPVKPLLDYLFTDMVLELQPIREFLMPIL